MLLKKADHFLSWGWQVSDKLALHDHLHRPAGCCIPKQLCRVLGRQWGARDWGCTAPFLLQHTQHCQQRHCKARNVQVRDVRIELHVLVHVDLGEHGTCERVRIGQPDRVLWERPVCVCMRARVRDVLLRFAKEARVLCRAVLCCASPPQPPPQVLRFSSAPPH